MTAASSERLLPCGPAFDARPFGIVDIGSNTVRLVIYRRLNRNPIPVWNEKATCALGRGLEDSGHLNPDGRALALKVIARYARLAQAMGIRDLDLVATAAVRDSTDGDAFVTEIEAITGLPVTVLSGEAEAQTAARGVLCAVPEADGLVADLGGGSLELIIVEGGAFRSAYASLPLGLLRLNDAAEGSLERAAALIDAALIQRGWLSGVNGRCLYAVGGAWRTLARVCIHLLAYPLHVLDNYALETDVALSLVRRIRAMGEDELRHIPGLSEKRLPLLPLAAVVLERLLEHARPQRLVFSVYGMREGRFYEHLPPKTRGLDPLISSCEALAAIAGRFPSQARELWAWMSPLFTDETPDQQRLRLAACLLGDAFWSEHPDYRADQAFQRVIKLPFMGLSHLDRAFLALSLHYRYTNEAGDAWVEGARTVLAGEPLKRARAVGQALRLGFAISAGAPGLLTRTALVMENEALILRLPEDDPAFLPILFSKRLSQLAKGLRLKGRIVTIAATTAGNGE